MKVTVNIVIRVMPPNDKSSPTAAPAVVVERTGDKQ